MHACLILTGFQGESSRACLLLFFLAMRCPAELPLPNEKEIYPNEFDPITLASHHRFSSVRLIPRPSEWLSLRFYKEETFGLRTLGIERK